MIDDILWLALSVLAVLLPAIFSVAMFRVDWPDNGDDPNDSR